MTQKDNIRMPMSTAGIMNAGNETFSGFQLRPSHVIVLAAFIIILVLLLHAMNVVPQP